MERLITGKLLAWKTSPKRKPLLLTGVRQVGKTYILKEFGSSCFAKYHYLNFEKEPRLAQIFDRDLDPKRILEELSFHLDCAISIEEDLVIFDEIQACSQALTSLKYFAEELPQLALVGAGSLLGIHLAPVSFPVGKVSILPLYPMTFEEFLMADGDGRALKILRNPGQAIPEIVHDHLWKKLKHYFVVGGMPECVASYCSAKENLFLAFQQVRELQDHLLIAYYADMAKHAGKINALHIDRVFRSISAQLQRNHDGTSSKFRFTGVLPNVSRYHRLAGAIDWLIAAGLAIKVSIVSSGDLPLQAHTKESVFKLFLFDVGILGALCGLAPKTILDYEYGSYKGFFAENFVAQALLAQKKQDLFCWQEKTAEVEFVREIEGRVIPIEVKSGLSIRAKSLTIFANKYAPPYRIIYSGQNLKIGKEIFQIPLYLAGVDF